MAYVPSKSQRMQTRRFMETQAKLVNEPGTPRVVLLVDEPNAFFSARGAGERLRPNYKAILEIAKSYGIVERALLVVNPGAHISERFVPEYEIVRGSDFDCDHLLISCAVVALAAGVNVMVLVSGDGRFSDVGKVCTRLGVKFVSVGMPHSTSPLLKAHFPFHPMPTFELQPAFASQSVAGGDDTKPKHLDPVGGITLNQVGDARQSHS